MLKHLGRIAMMKLLAFYNSWRSGETRLLIKFNLGIGGRVYNWIKDFLLNSGI